jgi:hypothetical protein
MPIHLLWDNEEHAILRIQFEDPWTWEDFMLASQQRNQWIEGETQRVDVLANMLNTRQLPAGSPLTQARSNLRNYPPNMGSIVIVTNNMFIDMMVNSFRKVFGNVAGLTVIAVSSFEAAYERIQQERAKA